MVRLYPAMTANQGPRYHLVHLADINGKPACGQYPNVVHRVRGRITCSRCIKRCAKAAARHKRKPLVIGLDFDAHYEAIADALEDGATRMPKGLPGPKQVEAELQ